MLQYISLADCERLIKNEFDSDEDTLLTSDINFPFSPNGTFTDALESPKKCSDSARKNKRKNLTPQRAVQSELSQSNSLEGNSSECSQDIPESIANSFIEETGLDPALDPTQDLIISDSELPESEDLLRDIDEENIFKGIQEEAGIVDVFACMYCTVHVCFYLRW